MEEDSIRLPAHLRECLRAPGTGKDRLTDGQTARGTAGSEGLTEQGQGAGPQAGEGQTLRWFSRDFAKLLCSLSPPPQHGFENLEISAPCFAVESLPLCDMLPPNLEMGTLWQSQLNLIRGEVTLLGQLILLKSH